MAGTRRAQPSRRAPEPSRRRVRGRARPPRRPDPEPLEIDDSKVILAGTIAWAVAFVVLLAAYGRLEDDGNEWWVWTALAGLGLGLWGWFLVRKRIAVRRAPGQQAPGQRTTG